VVSSYRWEPEKAQTNVWKHGITFEEAETALDSPLARWFEDRSYVGPEDRWCVFGYSDLGRLLLVVTSEGDPKPRIISAWRASKRERREYERR
jgi:uncharacterized DUF497 family protein